MRNVPALAGTPVIVPVVAPSFSPRGSAALVQRLPSTPPRLEIFAR